jgi:uncharacterized RDD family membrane protein YckC
MMRENSGGIAIDTGQGLTIDLPLAGIGARSFAFLIDWHIRVLLAVAWLSLFLAAGWLAKRFEFGNFSADLFGWLALVPAAGIYLLYHPLLELVMQGSSPGKRWAGVRVVAQDGRAASVSALVLRNVFRLIDSLPMFYCVGVVSCLCTRHALRVGDLAAGTVLVYVEHDGLELRRTIGRHAQAGTHDPELLRLATDVLMRWKELDDSRRVTLACALLARFGATPDAGDINTLHAQLTASLAAAEQR